MEARKRTRRVDRDRSECGGQPPRGAKQIVIPMTHSQYDERWGDAARMRADVDRVLAESPELFPSGMAEGYEFHGFGRASRKLNGVRLRKVVLQDGSAYWLRPSFVMSFMTGTVDELAYPLLLATHGVPAWLLTMGFGHNDMFWYRLVERLGRNSVVGTTARGLAELPQHLVADEHHVKWCGEKGYVATTAAGGCLLGVALSKSASEESLTVAYGDFVREARERQPEYSPQTVNTDGWGGTRNAFVAWFPTIALILCFLHGFLKIRDRCRKAHDLHTRVWDVYHAATAVEFRRLMHELQQWFEPQTWPAPVREMLQKLWNKTDDYATAYEHPNCHRTSNLVDRLMNRLCRLMYAGRGLHGHQHHSELRLRGWSLLLNFRPFAPRSGSRREHHSPAHHFSGKKYHDHWLHNLVVSTSLMGRRQQAPAIC